MARIRSVHPELFTDEGFCSLSPLARLLAIGIWTQCDDHGIFEWKPFGLKIALLPVDNADVPALLTELVKHKQIKSFHWDGKDYGAVRNFCVYQRPKKVFYKHPLPAELRTYVAADRRKAGAEDDEMATVATSTRKIDPPVTPQAATGTENRPHKERREGESSGGETLPPDDSQKPVVVVVPQTTTTTTEAKLASPKKPAGLAATLGTPLPEDWTPDDATIAAVRIDYDMLIDDINAELPGFHAHNLHHGTLSPNWGATFRLWAKEWKRRQGAKAPARVELSRAGPVKLSDAQWEGIAKLYADTGRWSRDVGPDPLQPGCKCPREILIRHDINPETGERRIPPRKVAAS